MTTESTEFEALLRAHAHRELTAEEAERLRAQADVDPRRAAEVDAWTALHRQLDAELGLREAIAAPAAAQEEADEGFQRLQAAAAGAEEDLRARLKHSARVSASPSWGWRRVLRRRALLMAVTAAAAALLTAWWLGRSGAPELLGSKPDDRTMAGSQRVLVIAPSISRQNRSLAWFRVAGAAEYSVEVVDESGNVVLRRSADQRKSYVWELTETEYESLAQSRRELFLRVQARDGTAVTIASSGDLPLTVR